MLETNAKTLNLAISEDSRAKPSITLVPMVLLLLGAGSLSYYFWGRDLHRFTQWVAAYIGLFIGQLAFYFAACYAVIRWPDRSSRTAKWATLALVIFFAIAFRSVLVPQRAYLSSDVYRYVWDGHVQTEGINPYRHIPEAGELSALRDDKIFPNINREDKQWLSPYPPVAQLVFHGVSLIRPLSVTAFKAVMSSFDLITIILLMLVLARSGIDPARAIIFAWHPLLIFESAHSGHIEAVFITFLVAALLAWTAKRHALTGVFLGLATMVKFYPVLLLPVFLVSKPVELPDRDQPVRRLALSGLLSGFINRRNLTIVAAFVATCVAVYLPYLGAGRNVFGFLSRYIQEEGFVQQGGRYFLLELFRRLFPVPTVVFLILAAACILVVALWWLTRSKRDAVDISRGATAVIGLYLIITTPRYAWYYAWLVPFLCIFPRVAWLYLSCASALLYLAWYTPMVYPGIPLWLGCCIYVPAVALLVLEHWKRPGDSRLG
ncbi:MAG: glycosyltransferase family 87 protein [Blastocatellia bacterium]